MADKTLTPEDLRDKLQSIYVTEMSDGRHISFEPNGLSWPTKPYRISTDGSHGQSGMDIRDAVGKMLDADRIGELGGTWCLMQWFDVYDAVAFVQEELFGTMWATERGLSCFDNEAVLQTACGGDDLNEYFVEKFKITGFLRQVTPEIKMELNDCSQLFLILRPR